ncbi:MAG: hypothetical protein GC151_15880 [Betaproteobacteria bacterium]|nr:hypothetical protein [Betaproteobacteria bacterium]
MNNVLFLVHGIGRHKTGWADEAGGPVEALNQAMALYPACFGDASDIRKFLTVVEVRYDDIFDLILNQWQALADSLGAVAGNIDWVGQVTQLLHRVGNNQSQAVDYGGDVILYHGFDLVARMVRLRVNSVIAAEILKAHVQAQEAGGMQVPRFGVIGHSLGTAVVQDALYQLATEPWVADEDVVAGALPGHPELIDNPHLSAEDLALRKQAADGTRAFPDRPIPVGLTLLCQLSNTTRLLRRSPGEYVLLRKPGGVLRPYDCEVFLNVNNRFDPVSRVCAYQMPVRPNGFDVVVDHIHEANVHGFGHYLSNPAVHGPIFRSLIADFSFECEQHAQTLGASPDWHGIGGDLAREIRQKQDELKARLDSLTTEGGGVQKLRDAIENLARMLGVKP